MFWEECLLQKDNVCAFSCQSSAEDVKSPADASYIPRYDVEDIYIVFCRSRRPVLVCLGAGWQSAVGETASAVSVRVRPGVNSVRWEAGGGSVLGVGDGVAFLACDEACDAVLRRGSRYRVRVGAASTGMWGRLPVALVSCSSGNGVSLVFRDVDGVASSVSMASSCGEGRAVLFRGAECRRVALRW